MSTAAFIKGCKLKVDGVEYALVRKVAPGEWQLEAQSTGELRRMTQSELLEGFPDGRVAFVIESGPPKNGATLRRENAIKQFDLLPDKLKQIAKRRRAVVKGVLKEFGQHWNLHLVTERIASIWKKIEAPGSPPHPVTVWRWTQRYLGSGQDIRSLVQAYHRSGNTTHRYPEEVEDIVRKAVDAKYLSEERGTYQDALDHAIKEIAQRNRLELESDKLPFPSINYVKAVARETSPFDRDVARYGRAFAERKFRAVLGKTIATAALARVEIDHTRLDVFVVDDETFLPLGRPWLTACIDARTRNFLGFYLGFDPPSYWTVARALKHAILPKTGLSTLYAAVKGTWDAYGVMDGIVVDNGPEFHSENLEAACYSLGIDIQYCPRKQPWFKGIIERALGTLNRGVAHGIPGTAFSNIIEKADYDAAKRATVTLRTLREMIHVWIIDYYHQRPHKGLGDTPAHAWKLETAGMDIRLPTKPKELDAVLGKIASRRLTHKGIEINSLFYHSQAARDLMYKLGPDQFVTVRHDDDDLGHIYVLDPDANEYLDVPALDQDYAKGLTLYQHLVCRRFAKRHLDGRTDTVALAEAKQRIQDLVDQEILRKGKHSRTRTARYRNGSQDGAHPSTPHKRSTGSPSQHDTVALALAHPAASSPAPVPAPAKSTVELGPFVVRRVQRTTTPDVNSLS